MVGSTVLVFEVGEALFVESDGFEGLCVLGGEGGTCVSRRMMSASRDWRQLK